LLVLQAGSIFGIPLGVVEKPPGTQYKITNLLVPPLIVLVPRQVIVICVPTET